MERSNAAARYRATWSRGGARERQRDRGRDRRLDQRGAAHSGDRERGRHRLHRRRCRGGVRAHAADRNALKKELLAQESAPNPDCDSWRFHDHRSQEHAGAVSSGAGNPADVLRIRDTTVIVKMSCSRIRISGISNPTSSLSTPPGATCRNSLNCWKAEAEVEHRVRREMARFEFFGRRFTPDWAHSSSRTTLICRASGHSGIWRLPNRSGASTSC